MYFFFSFFFKWTIKKIQRLFTYLFIYCYGKLKKKNVYTYDSSGSAAAFSLSFRPN